MAVNDAAARMGLRPGQRLNDARAIFPALETGLIDRAYAAQRLKQLSLWMQRFTPWVSIEDDDGLLLDITGCAHLFGGEDSLCAQISDLMTKHGMSARLAIAETPGAAWALSHFDKKGETLHSLPLAALRLDAPVVDSLNRLGFKYIADIIALPRAALARRFRSKIQAEDVLRRLDQALGFVADPRVPAKQPPLYRAYVPLVEPILEAAQIENWLRTLMMQLLPQLVRDHAGVRQLRLLCFGVDGLTQYISIGCARATRDAAHLQRLMLAKIAQLQPGFGFEALLLTATRTSLLEAQQHSLSQQRDGSDAIALLSDTLASRLPAKSLHKKALLQSHIPERSEERVAHDTRISAKLHTLARRPLFMLMRPEVVTALAEVPDGPPRQFNWRRRSYKITKAHGPERLTPEWWQMDISEKPRDYYWLEDQDGSQFWVFRYGLYEGETKSPGWYVHGIEG